jgi:hypothetical protein
MYLFSEDEPFFKLEVGYEFPVGLLCRGVELRTTAAVIITIANLFYILAHLR